MTELCRAALWYSENVEINDTKLHGIKALRECANIRMRGCDIISPEFGWSVRGITMEDCTAESEYFMMRSDRLNFRDIRFKGLVLLLPIACKKVLIISTSPRKNGNSETLADAFLKGVIDGGSTAEKISLYRRRSRCWRN